MTTYGICVGCGHFVILYNHLDIFGNDHDYYNCFNCGCIVDSGVIMQEPMGLFSKSERIFSAIEIIKRLQK